MYRYQSGGRPAISRDYEKAISVAETLFSHTRFHFPYQLVVIGYLNFLLFSRSLVQRAAQQADKLGLHDVEVKGRGVRVELDEDVERFVGRVVVG